MNDFEKRDFNLSKEEEEKFNIVIPETKTELPVIEADWTAVDNFFEKVENYSQKTYSSVLEKMGEDYLVEKITDMKTSKKPEK